ncbi:MAG TPA: M56 family metallopeptidase [Ruminiclostridium sp.]|nr:M56 family metallopeptidase [Ruminiclostridium sp.]
MSATGSVLALVLMLMKTALRQKLSAKFHYVIWFALLIRLLIPITVDTEISLPHFIPAYHQETVESAGQLQAVPYINTSINAGTADKDATGENTTGINDSKNRKKVFTGFGFNYSTAAGIWLVVVTGLLLYIISINIILLVRLKKLKKCDNQAVADILEQCRSTLGINAKTTVVLDKNVRSPRLYGLLHPKILVSQDVLDVLSQEEMRYIFLHELSHVKRRDLLINAVTMVVQSIYWFNPVIWYSIYKMKQDCEIACDATALDSLRPEENKKYGMTIIKMLTLMSEMKWVPGTLGFTGNYNKRRITMITLFKKSSVKWTAVAISLLLLTGCSSFLSPASDTKADATVTGQSTGSSTTDSRSTSSVSANSASASTDSLSSGSTDKADSTQAAQPTASGAIGSASKEESPSALVPGTAASTVQTQKGAKAVPELVSDQKALLLRIMTIAKQGKVINCEFSANDGVVIEDVQKKWGEADKPGEWIAAAKGTYWTYSKHNMVFGTNKGDGIFEIRSFDSTLKKITISDAKAVFGKPAYDVKTKGQEIIGYVAGNQHKILLVFPLPTKNNSNPALDHYSVLYPRGTVNMMADDPGREW